MAIARPRIVVIGGANVDIKARIEGHAVVGISNYGEISRSPGGVGRNIAESLARLDLPVQLVAALGDDADGELLLSSCQSAGVDCSLVVRPGGATGSYVAVLDPTGDLVIGVNAMRITEEISPHHIRERAAAMATAAAVVADANLAEETLEAIVGLCRDHGRPLCLEPVSDFKALKFLAVLEQGHPITLMTPNRTQLVALTDRRCGSEEDIRAAVGELHARGVERIIVGLGGDGAYASDGRRGVFVPAIETLVEDVTGGGDAAFAGALWALNQGHDIGWAARIGQAAASLAIAGRQAVAPTLSPQRLLALAQQSWGDPLQ